MYREVLFIDKEPSLVATHFADEHFTAVTSLMVRRVLTVEKKLIDLTRVHVMEALLSDRRQVMKTERLNEYEGELDRLSTPALEMLEDSFVAWMLRGNFAKAWGVEAAFGFTHEYRARIRARHPYEYLVHKILVDGLRPSMIGISGSKTAPTAAEILDHQQRYVTAYDGKVHWKGRIKPYWWDAHVPLGSRKRSGRIGP